MSKRDDAKADYLIGKSYKEIAEKYGVSAATVRAWKSRYKWPDKPRSAKRNKSIATQQKSATKTQHVATEQLIENDELTDKQKLFCIYYLQNFNATQAYLRAYDSTYKTASVEGSRTLVNPKIKAQIKEMKGQAVDEAFVELVDLIKDDAKQAFADIGDYVNFGNYEEYITDEKGANFVDTDGEPLVAHKSWVQLKNKDEVDTSRLEEITVGKDGAKAKLKPADKAKERLYKYFANAGKDENGMDIVGKLLEVITKGANKDDN